MERRLKICSIITKQWRGVVKVQLLCNLVEFSPFDIQEPVLSEVNCSETGML